MKLFMYYKRRVINIHQLTVKDGSISHIFFFLYRYPPKNQEINQVIIAQGGKYNAEVLPSPSRNMISKTTFSSTLVSQQWLLLQLWFSYLPCLFVIIE